MDGDSDPPLRWPLATLWAIVLGGFFFLIYGACNWITSLRAGIGSFYFPWERQLPFVPWMIVPYMSLDLFFVGAIFLCRRSELNTHAKRVVTAISIAAVCFLLFPLRFAFVRPETTGFPGMLFDWLKLDQPYNQFPSLHIALRSIVWAPYGRRVRGPLRWALIGWFVLIGASAVLTYQHHMIDIIGGEILTVVVFYLFPWSADETVESGSRNLRVASIYGVSAAALLEVAYALRPWGALLAWPAVSLALMTLAYAGVGARVFRKRNGRPAWAATLLLGPYLLGASISHAIYRRICAPWNQLTPHVILGCRLTSKQALQLRDLGVTAVLDLTAECRECDRLLGLEYKNVQILDLTLPTERQLSEAIAFIERHNGQGIVYIHCALGFSRSAGVLAAYLLKSSRAATAEQAIEMVRKVRPGIVVSPRWEVLLRKA